MPRKSRALVLSGGGSAGGAWMLGLLEGLREGGVNLIAADSVIGTSAGARTAAQLGTGTAGEVLEMFRASTAPQMEAAATLADFVEASMQIFAEMPDQTEASRRIANLEPLGGPLISEERRMELLAKHLPAQSWPETPLLITAVDAESGSRVTFDGGSGVPLLEAVAASGALPGIYPLTTIGGRRYADGGVHSLYNADLAKGSDIVVVITPLPLNDFLEAQLASELRAIGEARVEVVIADTQSQEAMGADPVSVDGARAAAEAGFSQATQELQVLGRVWN